MSHRGIYQKGQFIVSAAHSAALAAGVPRYGQPSKPKPETSLTDIEQRLEEARKQLEKLRTAVRR
jgi:hypothetical protein